MSKLLIVTFFAILSVSTLAQAAEFKLVGQIPQLETLSDLVSMGDVKKSGPDSEYLRMRGYQIYEITSEIRLGDMCTFKFKLKKENSTQEVAIEYYFFMSHLKSKYSDSSSLIDLCLKSNEAQAGKQ